MIEKRKQSHLVIGRLQDDQEAEACARLMASSEPWITLRRDYQGSLRLLQDPAREVWVARQDGQVVGFVILLMHGPLRGYIQTVGVMPEHRGRGIGSRLIRFVEERIFQESPNVFLCVSSFNTRAQDFYRRLGYDVIGEIKDFIVAGHSEILLRKTRGALVDFKPSPKDSTRGGKTR
jgi:ribosomal protein S18 acetylase RimI-like enzyme